jgi:hypothetical protein
VEELYDAKFGHSPLKPIYLIKAPITGLLGSYRLGGGYSDDFHLYDISITHVHRDKHYLDEYKSYVKFHNPIMEKVNFFVEVVEEHLTEKGGKPIRYNKRLKKSRKSNKKQSKTRKSKKRN